MSSSETAKILTRAKEILALARLGLADAISADPLRRRPGVMNFVVFGRSVTFVIQNLRATEPEFDEWYAPRVDAMKADPLMVFFKDLRNQIEKEGELEMATVLQIDYMDTNDLAPIMQNPPPGAKGFFMGDQLGGSGWEIELEDGSIEHFYVKLPSELAVKTWHAMPNAPTEHDGAPIKDASVDTLGALYLAALTELVDEAVERFSS